MKIKLSNLMQKAFENKETKTTILNALLNNKECEVYIDGKLYRMRRQMIKFEPKAGVMARWKYTPPWWTWEIKEYKPILFGFAFTYMIGPDGQKMKGITRSKDLAKPKSLFPDDPPGWVVLADEVEE